MTLVTEDKVEHALAILADKDGVASSARAAHQFEAERTKTIKARLMARCNEKTMSAREMYALAHEDYEAHLKHVQILNAFHLCKSCHLKKTRLDVKMIAKADRQGGRSGQYARRKKKVRKSSPAASTPAIDGN